MIVRHAFREPKSGKVLCCQTLYSHLNDINVVLGQLVLRGTQVGTIGTNRGMYPAHLHVELHYNPDVNCGHQGIPKTERNYGPPDGFYYPLPPPASGEKDGARSHRRVSALQGNGRTLTSGG